MKDSISLIAAAVGGFMLSIAAASIIKATPVTSLKAQPNHKSTPVAAQLRLQPIDSQQIIHPIDKNEPRASGTGN